MSLYRESSNSWVICGYTEQCLTLHGFPWKSQSTQEGEAVISATLEPEGRNLLMNSGQAVKGYWYCSVVGVQVVSLCWFGLVQS